MGYLADNVKVLLWQNKNSLLGSEYDPYISFVAQQCKIDSPRFINILKGHVEASDNEVERIRSYFSDLGYDLDAIQYRFLFEELIEDSEEIILAKNLHYLLNSIKHGSNILFTEAIGVNPSTLTRWKQGKTMPDKYALSQIAHYFGFPDSSYLKTKLLFLNIDAVSLQQKKDECKRMIDSLDRESFEIIFPAICKLLS